MHNFIIKQGLDIRMDGEAAKRLSSLRLSQLFYIRPSDFQWIKPKLLVSEGDSLKVGTPLFCSKNDERIWIPSPISGTVKQIARGEKRVVEAIVIQTESESSIQKCVELPSINSILQSTEDDAVKADFLIQLLLQNGLWCLFRQRPFSVIPKPEVRPKSVVISCFDSAPLAPDYSVLLQGREEEFYYGLTMLSVVSAGAPIHLCMREGADNELFEKSTNVQKSYFKGPHPSGNVSTQIHRICPINKGDTIWYLHPVAVAMIGRFFLKGEILFQKTIALTGPEVLEPHYFQTIYGADIQDILQDNLKVGNIRIISGNVLTGLKISNFPTVRFYDHQITVLHEGGEREVLGWLLPGVRKWSFSHTFIAWLQQHRLFQFNTSLNGGRRAFMMTDVYDKVFPFDIMPLQLMKACQIKDFEQMESLGIYEVDSEDFALCELVCPSKIECQQLVEEALFELYINQ